METYIGSVFSTTVANGVTIFLSSDNELAFLIGNYSLLIYNMSNLETPTLAGQFNLTGGVWSSLVLV